MAPTETDIAIVQLVFWVPVLPLAIWLWVRYGFRLGAGAWRLVLVLALLRIIAGSCALAAEARPSASLYAAVLSCDLIGTAPLFLLSLRLIERVNNTYHKVPEKLYRLADLSSLAGLALGIVGANKALTSSIGGNQPFVVNGYMNAAMALFIVVLAFNIISLAVLFLPAVNGHPISSTCASSTHQHPKSTSVDSASSPGGDIDIEHGAAGVAAERDAGLEQREVAAARKIVVAVALAMPFLIVRMLYAAIGDFRNDVNFIPYLGDRSIYLGMSVVMEIVAAYICLAVGFAVPPPPKKAKKSAVAEQGTTHS